MNKKQLTRHEEYSRKQGTRNNKQEARHNKQNARNRKQETTNKQKHKHKPTQLKTHK